MVKYLVYKYKIINIINKRLSKIVSRFSQSYLRFSIKMSNLG
jgi:hypothetical protein